MTTGILSNNPFSLIDSLEIIRYNFGFILELHIDDNAQGNYIKEPQRK